MNTLSKIAIALSVAFVVATAFIAVTTQTSMAFGTGGGDDCGSCGGDGGNQGGGDRDPVPPVCNYLRGDKTSLPVGGGSVNLTWSTSYGTAATLTPDGSAVAVNGSKTVNVTKDTTFVLRVTNRDGADTCQLPITVAKPTPAPVCDSFTVTPDTLPVGGGDVTLKWETTNATKVTISGLGQVNPDNTVGRVVPVTQTTNFVLTAENADGVQVTCADRVVVPTPNPAPVCDYLTVTPDTLPVGGGDVTLKWETTNATKVTISGLGQVNPDNTVGRVVPVTQTTNFVLTAENADGVQVTCADRVVVETPNPAPTCDAFTVTPTNLPIGGGNVTLTWETSNATNVKLDGVAVAVDGTKQVSVTASKTFTLTVTNATDSVDCTARVTVATPNPTPACVSFTGTPTSLPIGGGTVTLTWDTENAALVTIDNGVGTVSADGTQTVSVTDDITYTLTAARANGEEPDTCTVPITVADPVPTGLSCSDVSFTASDTSVSKGTDVVLSWNANSKVTSVSINNGIGDVANAGSRTVNITGDITYFITIANADSNVSCPLSIDVETSGGGGGGSSSPRCDLEISDKSITLGEEITLKWDTSRATEVVIEDDHGNVVMTTEDKLSSDKDEYYDGEITLKPTKDTTYTLNASRGTRDRECEVKVDVKNSVTVLETRDQQPRVAGIALTQVPYTGFEAGPMLTFIFYALLTLWALFVAYVLVIKRDSLGGVSLAGAHEHTDFVDQSVEAAASARLSQAEAYVASVTPTMAPTNLPTVSDTAPVIGYAALATEDTEENRELAELENTAHMNKALISSDAMRYFMSTYGTGGAALDKLTAVIATGKTSYPSEDGWLVINLARLEALLATPVEVPNNLPTVANISAQVATVPATGVGSLAEAIVTGNVVAAYQMIAHRPMIALADAAADLDAAYRARKGETVAISDLLTAETAQKTTEQLEAAIAALTGALDGTYTSEAEAVKMAIMKAVKALA